MISGKIFSFSLIYTLLTAITAFSVISPNLLMAQSITSFEPSTKVQPGKTCLIDVGYDIDEAAIVKVQLFDSNWNKVDDRWKTVAANSQSTSLMIPIPKDASIGDEYLWQGQLYQDSSLRLFDKKVVYGVKVVSDTLSPEPPSGVEIVSDPPSTSEWLPPDANWTLDWNDEFEGTGEPANWYPLLGYEPDSFHTAKEKGLRWSGDSEDTAWMFSTRSGNHWKDGSGNLVLQAVSKKKELLVNGPKVETAYLLTGYPAEWDKNDPNYPVRWKGKHVSPADGDLYISVRVKTNDVVGYSSWFAFWLFSETRAYNDNPADGTEVDIIEVPKGKQAYFKTTFNCANHSFESESYQFADWTTPPATDFVDVSEDKFHTYGLHWSKDSMTCYVDGKALCTFTKNIPTDPVDMFMLLTLEFQKDLWGPDQGDGRFEGPYVSDQGDIRVMSRVYVDYVRVYRKQS